LCQQIAAPAWSAAAAIETPVDRAALGISVRIDLICYGPDRVLMDGSKPTRDVDFDRSTFFGGECEEGLALPEADWWRQVGCSLYWRLRTIATRRRIWKGGQNMFDVLRSFRAPALPRV